MGVIGILALKRGFDSTQTQAPDTGQVIPRAVDGAAAVGAEHPRLMRDGAIDLAWLLLRVYD